MGLFTQSTIPSPPPQRAEDAGNTWHPCKHDGRTANRRRQYRNGQVVYCKQCLNCGAMIGGSYGQAKCFEKHGFRPSEATEFDEQLSNRIWSAEFEQRKLSREIRETERKAEWSAWYSDYLRSTAWQKRRTQVLKRANFVCEGCGENRASEVHHKTYENVGAEFLFELVALCCECHRRFHGR